MATDRVLAQAYVALGQGGLMKVGYSKNFKKRLPYLRKEFKAKGDVLVQHVVFDQIEAAYTVERALISYCADKYEQHSGREWFKSGDFADAAQEAKRLTEKWKNHRYPKPLSEAQIAELRARQCAEKQRQAEQRAAWMAALLKRTEARRAKRLRPQRVLEQIVAFALGSQSSLPTP